MPSFQDDYIDYIVRSTGSRLFRRKETHADWVWVIPGANKTHNIQETPGGLNGRIPTRLNSIFKIRLNRGDMVYQLAHVTMTTVIGARTAGREEGMVKVQLSVPTKDVLVNVWEIGGMAHMIPIEP